MSIQRGQLPIAALKPQLGAASADGVPQGVSCRLTAKREISRESERPPQHGHVSPSPRLEFTSASNSAWHSRQRNS
ncbi:MAG TPA: hypothetical protein VNJ09_11070 [Chthonomonadales bacterium]|nr:hypothetical protein [Chthonomonadales bacterium]